MKNKIVIWLVVALLLLGIAGRFFLIWLCAVRSTQTAMSPDQRYTAKVTNDWYADFWGEKQHEHHRLEIDSVDGREIRRVVTDEPWIGWPHNGSIEWAKNSASITFTFKTSDSLKTRLMVDVTP